MSRNHHNEINRPLEFKTPIEKVCLFAVSYQTATDGQILDKTFTCPKKTAKHLKKSIKEHKDRWYKINLFFSVQSNDADVIFPQEFFKYEAGNIYSEKAYIITQDAPLDFEEVEVLSSVYNFDMWKYYFDESKDDIYRSDSYKRKTIDYLRKDGSFDSIETYRLYPSKDYLERGVKEGYQHFKSILKERVDSAKNDVLNTEIMLQGKKKYLESQEFHLKEYIKESHEKIKDSNIKFSKGFSLDE